MKGARLRMGWCGDHSSGRTSTGLEEPVLGVACVRGGGLICAEVQHRLFTAVRSSKAGYAPLLV